jgi:echinoderm microtubule-associated protein-like 5
VDRVARGRKIRMLVPLRRRILDQNATAAVFIHFGFDKYGCLPYEVFNQALNETPARLLGHELLLNKTLRGKNGVEDMVDVAFLIGDAKVDYPKSTMSVFPPRGFDDRLAQRSMKVPRAHMFLEHVYGYAGMRDLCYVLLAVCFSKFLRGIEVIFASSSSLVSWLVSRLQ